MHERGRPHPAPRFRERGGNPARSETPNTCGRTSHGNREVPCSPRHESRPHREVSGRTAMMDGHGKSDRFVVPQNSPNNARERAAEVGEGRKRTKGNVGERNALRTQGRAGASTALDRVRQAAKRNGTQRFTALLHHVYDVDRLRAAYLALTRAAAAGVDGGRMGRARRVRSGRCRAAVSVRSWPTSISMTCSTSGSSDGGGGTPTAMSSWCALPTTSSWVSSVELTPSGASPRCATGSRGPGTRRVRAGRRRRAHALLRGAHEPAHRLRVHPVIRVWWRTLGRRSQRRLPWYRMRHHVARWIPPLRICHPYPLVRFGVATRGGGRMR